MNSQFITQVAKGLASRVSEGEETGRIDRLHRIAFGRSAGSEEIELCRRFVQTNGWEQLAQVLLMTNEFMFVD